MLINPQGDERNGDRIWVLSAVKLRSLPEPHVELSAGRQLGLVASGGRWKGKQSGVSVKEQKAIVPDTPSRRKSPERGCSHSESWGRPFSAVCDDRTRGPSPRGAPGCLGKVWDASERTTMIRQSGQGGSQELLKSAVCTTSGGLATYACSRICCGKKRQLLAHCGKTMYRSRCSDIDIP